MVDAVQMDGMRHVVRVFEGDIDLVALLDPDGRARCTQQGIGLHRLEVFSGHAHRFGRKNPQARANARRDLILGHGVRAVRRAAVQFGHLQTDMNLVRIPVAVEIPTHDHGIGRQSGLHQGRRRHLVRPLHSSGNEIRIVGDTVR